MSYQDVTWVTGGPQKRRKELEEENMFCVTIF